MKRIARFIVEHPERILGLTALITVTAVVLLFRIQFNADVASAIVEGNERGEEFAALQEKWGHIQEIIIQNFRAKYDTPMRRSAEPVPAYFTPPSDSPLTM